VAQAIEGVVEPVTFDDGKGSYLPSSAPADLRREVDRIAQALAPQANILYGTGISHRGDTRAGMWIGPPVNSIIINPRQDEEEQTATDLAVATAIHECAHAALTPAAQEQYEIMYRERVGENDRMLYNVLVDVLEDERIETIVVKRRPEWRPALKKRWDRLLLRFGAEIQEAQVFQQYGPQSLQAAAKLDYLNNMVGNKKWYRRAGTPLHGDLLSALVHLSKRKQKDLHQATPETVPNIAHDVVTFARARAHARR
jgi:hypothetical protein